MRKSAFASNALNVTKIDRWPSLHVLTPLFTEISMHLQGDGGRGGWGGGGKVISL